MTAHPAAEFLTAEHKNWNKYECDSHTSEK